MTTENSVGENKILLLPYTAKTIQFIELWEEDGWRTKLYGVYGRGMQIDEHLIQIAKEIARRTLPQPAITDDRYGLAFVTIHPSLMFNQIIVDWWERDNELRHHVFKANPETPFAFDDITATGEAFCVWELRVIGFEREAWLMTMLLNSKGPEPAKYLARRLDQIT